MSNRLTVGVVIDLPEPHATIIRRWRRQVGDPQADIVPPHVTLLPPTPVPAESLDEIGTHLAEAATACPPFAMHLSGTGTFRPLSQVVFVQVAAGIAECELLASAIRRGPLDRDLEFPFHPHVTVAHDIDPESLDAAYDGLDTFVARFTVDRFALFSRSDSGAWIVQREFALGPA